jgi:penicillin-binding protein 1A
MANEPSSPGQAGPEPDGSSSRWRIRRDASGLFRRAGDLWRSHVWVRRAGYGLGVLAALYLLVWITVIRRLPSAIPRAVRSQPAKTILSSFILRLM